MLHQVIIQGLLLCSIRVGSGMLELRTFALSLFKKLKSIFQNLTGKYLFTGNHAICSNTAKFGTVWVLNNVKQNFSAGFALIINEETRSLTVVFY